MDQDTETITEIIEKKREKRGFSSLLKNKKASAFYFLYVAAFVIAMALLYVIYSQVIQQYLQPVAQTYWTANDVIENNRILGLWNLVPYLVVLVPLAFFLIRTGQTARYQG